MQDLDTLNYFLGLEVTSSSNGYYLSQAKYVFDLLSKAGITGNKTISTPLEYNAKLTPLDSNLYQMLLVIISWLVVWFISLSLAQIFHMPWVWLVSSWTPLILSTMMLFFRFSITSRAHFIMVFTTLLNLLSSSMLIQMWIRQVIRLINAPSQVFVSYWVLLLSHGVVRSRTWFPIPVPRLSIVLLLTPPMSLSGFNGSWLTWMLDNPL